MFELDRTGLRPVGGRFGGGDLEGRFGLEVDVLLDALDGDDAMRGRRSIAEEG
jgi:hypothetical protein